jgi:hypothetical protein
MYIYNTRIGTKTIKALFGVDSRHGLWLLGQRVGNGIAHRVSEYLPAFAIRRRRQGDPFLIVAPSASSPAR